MPDNLPEELLGVQSQMATFAETQLKLNDDSLASQHQRVRDASKLAGFFFKTQPAEFGGAPASSLELTMLREMLAATNSPLSSSVFGPGPGVLHSAEGTLRSDYLEPVLRGEKRGAFGFTEPDSAPRPTADHGLASGLYFCRLGSRSQGGQFMATHKMVLMK